MSVPNSFSAVSSATGAQLDANFAAVAQLNATNNLTGVQNFAPPVSLASASTVNIGAALSNSITITGISTITNFDILQAGAFRTLTYSGAVPITYNSTWMQLIGNANRTNNAGDISTFVSLGSGNWKEIAYQPIAGYQLATGTTGNTAQVAANLYNSQFLGGL